MTYPYRGQPNQLAEHQPHQTSPIKRKLMIMIVPILMFSSFIAGNITGYFAHPALAAENPAEFALFWEAWEIAVADFVDRERIDFKAMTYGAIRGMLDSLGDENHTVFFAPEEATMQARRMEGSFEGIGAYVSQEEGAFTIVAPILGSPAEVAGLLAGDTVLAVDGEAIEGKPQWEVISKIRGPAGTTVTLTVLHPDQAEAVDIDVTRDRIDVPSVQWTRIPDTDYAYLQITQFASDTSQELQQALTEIQDADQPVDGLLLDLRNNPGGFLLQALLTANHFLEEGDIILHERDASGTISTHNARGSGLARELPMVVLINEGSASAAEILAGAIQQNGRAKLIGETTLGTGTVLRPYTLSDGSVIRLGVTNWLTPEFDLIKDQGIKPNIMVGQETAVEMITIGKLDTLSTRDLRTFGDRQFNMGLFYLRLNRDR